MIRSDFLTEKNVCSYSLRIHGVLLMLKHRSVFALVKHLDGDNAILKYMNISDFYDIGFNTAATEKRLTLNKTARQSVKDIKNSFLPKSYSLQHYNGVSERCKCRFHCSQSKPF